MKKLVLSLLVAFFATSAVVFGENVDYTSCIRNPSFEDGFDGWTTSQLQTQGNSSFTQKAGSLYAEKWVGTGSAVGNASAKQTVINLPFGKYILTAGAQNMDQNDATAKKTGVTIYAGSASVAVYTPADYSVEFDNTTGSVEIGFKAVSAKGNWICVDNFRLYKTADLDDATLNKSLTDMVSQATAMQAKQMTASVKAKLNAAINAANLVLGGTDKYSDQIFLDLADAMSKVSESVEIYSSLNTAINNAEAKYNAGSNGAEEFLAAINSAKTLIANTDATDAQLKDETASLEKAIFAFAIANPTAGTGTAPKVSKSYSFVVAGATEALVRADFQGANILEKGVCWSTERNPTVLDERTTKSMSLNGTIIHVKGLQPSTVYYARAYIINKTYTVAYGDEVKIVTHPLGTCKGTWNEGAPDAAANKRCRDAINQTIDYFNEWTGVMGFTLSGNYGSQTQTADCSYGGWMRIGPNAGNQAIGTVIHETGHGVGVGTSDRWWDTAVHNWKWYGRYANEVYSFLENKTADPYNSEFCMVGDGTHGWGKDATYDWFVNGSDKDKHLELQYIGGCALLYGLFIDGLNPTNSQVNGVAGYTYNFDADKKYYIMNKSSERGLGTALLVARTKTQGTNKECLTAETLSDSCAWYIEYNPKNGMYMFRNAGSGSYLTHNVSSASTSYMSLSATEPSTNQYFQLMPDRTDVTIGTSLNKKKTHGYWFSWVQNGSIKAMSSNAISAKTKLATLPQASFDYKDSATTQQWIIFSEDELQAYRDIAVATAVENIGTNASDEVDAVYSVDGTKHQNLKSGVNIVRFSDGSVRKVIR